MRLAIFRNPNNTQDHDRNLRKWHLKVCFSALSKRLTISHIGLHMHYDVANFAISFELFGNTADGIKIYSLKGIRIVLVCLILKEVKSLLSCPLTAEFVILQKYSRRQVCNENKIKTSDIYTAQSQLVDIVSGLSKEGRHKI